jgi:hypothetical protein
MILAVLILCGAHDAGLDLPEEITPAALRRHTYLAFLLRLGIRAADIGRIAGPIPNNHIRAYVEFAGSRARQPLEQIGQVQPVLCRLAGRIAI